MGYPGQTAHPAVRDAVLTALARIKAAGKAAGVLSMDPGFIAQCRAAGASFVGVGSDVTVLATGLRALAARHRG
jgi:4-hydroxy-2-oxoheptanedioate aldolase